MSKIGAYYKVDINDARHAKDKVNNINWANNRTTPKRAIRARETSIVTEDVIFSNLLCAIC